MRMTALILIMICAIVSTSQAQLVINEVGTGAVDYVEIMNVSAAAVALGGFQFWHASDTVSPNASGVGVPTVSINTNRSLFFVDNGGAGLPALQAGTAAYLLPGGSSFNWAPGNPGSCSILDATGNGIDYFAFGNPNGLIANLSNGAGAPTIWSGPGAPKWGAESGVNSSDTFVRNTRGDTDSADDWNMTTAANWSPSILNAFQTFTNADGLPPTASFTASTLAGAAPLTVRFDNTSTGDCQLGTVGWDFDFTANPGMNTSTLFNDSFTFVNPGGTTPGSVVNYDVRLQMMDSCGGSATSAIVTIAVTEPFPSVAQVFPFLEDFEGPTDPNTGTSMTALAGWDLRKSSSNARIRTVDPSTVGAPGGYADALRAQPTAVIMDSAGPGLNSIQEVVLHLNADVMELLNAGQGFRLVFYALHNGEVPNANDLVLFQDGITAGNATDNLGNNLVGTPGLDGFQEVLLSDIITDIGPSNTWTRFEFNIDSAFFTSNGLASPNPLGGSVSDARLVFRHEANGTYSGGQGLLIDRVQILTQNVPSAGSPGIPGLAVMDLSNAVNINDHFVSFPGDEAGPHFSTLAMQGTMNIDIVGEPNQPILLLAGPLNILAADYTGLDPLLGQFDIGGPIDPMGIPTSLQVLADGSGTQLPPTLLNLIWNTGADGVFSLSAALPPGIPAFTMIPMQSVVFRTGGVSLSNAVVLTVQ